MGWVHGAENGGQRTGTGCNLTGWGREGKLRGGLPDLSHHTIPPFDCRGFLMLCFCQKVSLAVCAMAAGALIQCVGRSENWPQWRGGRRAGMSQGQCVRGGGVGVE